MDAPIIKVCDECLRVFCPEEGLEDGKWGHLCKMRNYKVEHRCESYLQEYKIVTQPDGEK